MEVFTIGFTQRSAAGFFGALSQAGVRRLVDVRLNNSSQLAGFAKREDLRFFLETICKAEYRHEALLAPTQEVLDNYRKRKGGWEAYERSFLGLLRERKVEEEIDPALFAAPTVLLCSERAADHCHRRLVVEYLRDRWGNLEITHL